MKGLPKLFEFLQDGTYEDGSKRGRGTITMFIEHGRAGISLNLKPMKLVAFTSGATVLDALQAAEKGLLDGSHDWRASVEKR
jgi:hypothetical protein